MYFDLFLLSVCLSANRQKKQKVEKNASLGIPEGMPFRSMPIPFSMEQNRVLLRREGLLNRGLG
ncbi:MAG: hypothetical protein JWM43_2214 [Acidobacteriaceae bacterium]|nr:hypothetical protein [Acidobacteriaceae bacterium]